MTAAWSVLTDQMLTENASLTHLTTKNTTDETSEQGEHMLGNNLQHLPPSMDHDREAVRSANCTSRFQAYVT